MQIFQYKKEGIDALLTMQNPCQTQIRDFFCALICLPDLQDFKSPDEFKSSIQTCHLGLKSVTPIKDS